MAQEATDQGGKLKRVRGLTAVPRHFTASEVGRRLGVQRRTVRRWVEGGEFPNAIELPPKRPGQSGSFAIPEADVVAFCERRKWNGGRS